MHFDLTPYEISLNAYYKALGKKVHYPMHFMLYDAKEKYGIDNGYFNVDGIVFWLRKGDRGVAVLTDQTYNYSIDKLLNITPFNREVTGITEQNLSTVPKTFTDNCINDMFDWMIDNSDRPFLFKHNFVDIDKLKQYYYTGLEVIFGSLYILFQREDTNSDKFSQDFVDIVNDLYPIMSESFNSYDYIEDLNSDVEKIVKKYL